MRTDSRKTIQQLTPSVINKIAAGEVIERPASVVKELVENAVDAGATRVDVTVVQGGAESIRVVDDGHGIPASEIPLAVTSHATSKIRDADDLFSVDTMGFRGEALASIAEVSQLCLRSRTSDADSGYQLDVVGGRSSAVEPCGCAVGTTLEVRKLFFNTPVRRKFLRTTQTEMGHASEALTRIALAHPEIHFTLRHNQRTLFDMPPVQDIRQRVGEFFGADVAEGLIWVHSEDGPVSISGYVANPNHSRGSNKHQYIFLNGRHIRDRALQHALTEAYRGLLLTGRHPIAFLRMVMPPEHVDVNVHPTKLEVRFQDGGRLYSQLLGMLRTRFLTTDLTATVQPSANEPTQSAPSIAHDPSSDSSYAGQMRAQITDWARGADAPEQLRQEETRQQARLPLTADEFRATPRPWPEVGTNDRSDWNAEKTSTDLPGRSDLEGGRVSSHGMQIHDRYLVTESEEGIVIIDQHALHERILYEQLREKMVAGSVEKQQLLVPEPVQLSPVEAAAVLQARDLLSDLGIDVADFGGGSVVVSSYPAMLANFSPGELMPQLAEQLAAGNKPPDQRDVLDELLHMISCKAAIKAGDRLSREEVESLIDQRHLVQDSHHCPHGRPTTLVFTRRELDHRFKRT